MARGALARRRLRPDTAVAVTGVAGPTGGSDEVPVGTVSVCAMRRDGANVMRRDGANVMRRDGASVIYRVQFPGGRAEVRRRATTLAMHALRAVLAGERLRVPQIDT
jgi:nicotinamide-nucleotide amidase